MKTLIRITHKSKAMNKLKYLMLLLLMLPFMGGHAQGKGIQEVVIKTSAQCGMCKDRIEKELAFTKGVKYAVLDLETKDVTVRFSEKKTTADEIRKVLSGIGYDADSVLADPVAYEKLPACCKKGGHDQEH